MLSVGIVGSQGKSFSQIQEREAKHLIKMIVMSYGSSQVRLISGGALGVDTWAEEIALAYNWGTQIHYPQTYDWESFKERNIRIAEASDILYAIRSTKSKTYGSGWTADYAEKIGKDVYRYFV